jgi:hypothetical protein
MHGDGSQQEIQAQESDLTALDIAYVRAYTATLQDMHLLLTAPLHICMPTRAAAAVTCRRTGPHTRLSAPRSRCTATALPRYRAINSVHQDHSASSTNKWSQLLLGCRRVVWVLYNSLYPQLQQQQQQQQLPSRRLGPPLVVGSQRATVHCCHWMASM